MANQPIKIFIVDDHNLVRRGMTVFLEEHAGFHVVGEAGNGPKAIELVQQLNPDVVLADLLMPGMDGLEMIKRMIAIQPDQRIIILTASTEDDKLFMAIKAGARGYVRKDAQPEELIETIEKVHAGEPALSPAIAWRVIQRMANQGRAENPQELTGREIEVLRLLAEGKTDQEMAEILVLTEVTIRTHVSRILGKLCLENRVQATLYGLRTGMVTLDEKPNSEKVVL